MTEHEAVQAEHSGEILPLGRPTSTGRTSYIKCPWFLAHSRNEVQCVGFVEDSRVILRFREPTRLDQQERIFCQNKWENCEVCRMLEQVYNEP